MGLDVSWTILISSRPNASHIGSVGQDGRVLVWPFYLDIFSSAKCRNEVVKTCLYLICWYLDHVINHLPLTRLDQTTNDTRSHSIEGEAVSLQMRGEARFLDGDYIPFGSIFCHYGRCITHVHGFVDGAFAIYPTCGFSGCSSKSDIANGP